MVKNYDKENVEPIGRILSCQMALSTNFRNTSNRASTELLKIHRKKSVSVLTQPATYKNSMSSTTKKNAITIKDKDYRKSNFTKQTRTNS